MEQLVEFIGNNLILCVIWLVITILLIRSLISSSSSGLVTTAQMTSLINQHNAVVIDLRVQADFRKGHIFGAQNISFEQLKDNMAKLEKHKNNPIILVCQTGIQSGTAAQQLKKAGFAKLFRLKGGLNSWVGERLPLHS